MEIKAKYSTIHRIFLSVGLGWTILIAGLTIWSLNTIDKQTSEVLLSQARSFFDLIVSTRYWNALHGGVYVPVTAETQPNPYLDIPERDLTTESGELLTLINPAYMTRQISEIASTRNHVQFHITSAQPLRPENFATAWEARALTTFSPENDEYYDWWVEPQKTQRHFRYMAPLWVERPCLRCHEKQGYAEGNLRGGISITIPADPLLASQAGYKRFTVVIYLLIWILGIIGTIVAFGTIRREINQREGLVEQLRNLLGEVKTLKGFIPICASCKKVRDDVGYWEQIEIYIRDRSDVEFSHAICPDCMEKLYPEFNNKSANLDHPGRG